MNNLILQPILFMGALITIMMIWMYATRIHSKTFRGEGYEYAGSLASIIYRRNVPKQSRKGC